jgi:uncharacterized protein (DUF2164 family)
MNQPKRQWDMLSEERRQQIINEIVTFFKESRDETIGVIAAEDLLDFFLQNVTKDIYNKGVTDAGQLLAGRLADLQIDLDQLINK